MLLQSSMLSAAGFAHGFSTREGGVSKGPFSSLNLGRSVGDEPADVEENLRRFAAALAIGGEALFAVSQVHGAAVRVVRREEDPARVRAHEADALLATEAGVTVGIRTADCVPILVGDPETGRASAIHAGWRGIVRGVVASALEVLAPSGRAVAAIGPCIGSCCFEIGDDVAAEIAQAVPSASVIVPGRRPHADLRAAARRQLLDLGVGQVQDVGGCTHCDQSRFFSYRRDGQRSGRMLSAIASAPRASVLRSDPGPQANGIA